MLKVTRGLMDIYGANPGNKIYFFTLFSEGRGERAESMPRRLITKKDWFCL